MAQRVLNVARGGRGPGALPGPRQRRPPTLAFADVVHDSRLARPGSLFVALRGERDGHDFAARRGPARGERRARRAAAAGVGVAAVRPRAGRSPISSSTTPCAALQRLARWWRERQAVEVIGVTGSVGKTSTKEVVAGVLWRRFRVLRNEKNYNNEIGLPLTLLTLDGTHEKAVLEMGMYDLGEIRDLCALALPRVGVVTNVGPVHLERLGTIERIAAGQGGTGAGAARRRPGRPQRRRPARAGDGRQDPGAGGLLRPGRGAATCARATVAERRPGGRALRAARRRARAPRCACRCRGSTTSYNALAAAAVGLARRD